MGGGLMQLVAYGAQDVIITGNPQITFFKIVYRRHTNFAIESIENTFMGEADFGKKITFTIARNGDLLGPMHLEVELGVSACGLYNNSDLVGDYKFSTKSDDFNGWLICNGRPLNKFDYWNLFEKIGYSFGGSGNTFLLPDLRGKVLGNIGTGKIEDTFSPSGINIGQGTITLDTNKDKWNTCMPVQFETTGTLPSPLVLGQTYYLIRKTDTLYRVCLTIEDAINDQSTCNDDDEDDLEIHYIGLSDSGSGVHKIISYLSQRNLGDNAGDETRNITIAEIPSHTHTTNANGPVSSGIGYGLISQTNPPSGTVIVTDNIDNEPKLDAQITALTIDNTGCSVPHTNMQPTLFGGNVFIYSGNNNDIFKHNQYIKDHLIRWGFQLIDFIEIEIGGQLMDRHYGDWLDIWTQLTYSKEKYEQLLSMLNTSIFSSSPNSEYERKAKVYVPLQFWFNRNPGLYLPLIALQYSEVKINIQLNTKDIVNTATKETSNFVKINNFNYDDGIYQKTHYIQEILDFKVFGDYIFLDTDERKRFAETEHEYLIEQVQTSSLFNTNHNLVEIPLYFNHPCKYIIWRGQKLNYIFQDGSLPTEFNNKYFLSQLYDFTALGGNSSESNIETQLYSDVVNTAKLRINGSDRFKERDGSYFRLMQPNQYTSAGASSISFYNNSLKRYGGGFYMYNFGLKTDEHQPSGTCNFSRLDNAVLSMRINPYASSLQSAEKCYHYAFRLYAVNYNVLRIMSGMGGLAYSN